MGRYMMINTAEMYWDMRTGRRELILGRSAQRSHQATPQSAWYVSRAKQQYVAWRHSLRHRISVRSQSAILTKTVHGIIMFLNPWDASHCWDSMVNCVGRDFHFHLLWKLEFYYLGEDCSLGCDVVKPGGQSQA
jgi:hypothetical protein